MQYTSDELKRFLFPKVYEVYQIFQDFFGEDYVDLQNEYTEDLFRSSLSQNFDYLETADSWNIPEETSQEEIENSLISYYSPFILVYWPSVTVTNEYGKSTVIHKLFAKIRLSKTGEIPYESHGFQLNRACYTVDEFRSNYLHSHIPGIPTDDFTRFMFPCLGTGPIRNTIATLKNGFDEAFWLLFCQELSLYVTVESIAGHPYHRLEEIKAHGSSPYCYGRQKYYFPVLAYMPTYSIAVSSIYKDFIYYYLEHGHLSFDFVESAFVPGIPYYQYMMDISNTFIDYVNLTYGDDQHIKDYILQEHLLTPVYVVNRRFYTERRGAVLPPREYEGRTVCFFKGEEIKISILDSGEREETSTALILNEDTAMYILTRILTILNADYKNGNNKHRIEEGSFAAKEAGEYV